MPANRRSLLRAPLPGVLLALALLPGCATFGSRSREEPDPEAEARRAAPMEEVAATPESFLEKAEGIYVVVDLDVNRLRLMDGDRALWEAPVGTGTGLRLKGEDGEWHFSTPRGVFRIQFKEEMPVWILPDWYFLERGLPIPPENSPSRKLPNQLGVAAVYLGEEIAIHGTDKPELLGQRVSHGCIRLANQYVQRLYHNVQVGTPVVVVGGEDLEDVSPGPTAAPGKPRPPQRDTLSRYSTPQLVKKLETALVAGDRSGAWAAYTSRLITRGLKDDADALRGMLSLAGKSKSAALNREYATFLADAFARGALRTVVSLARVEAEARDRAAEAIVEATMSLHPRPLEAELAPWPTRRVPEGRLGPDGQKGWQALRKAETEYREKLATRTAGRS